LLRFLECSANQAFWGLKTHPHRSALAEKLRALSCWYLLNSRLTRFWASTNSQSTTVSPDALPRPSLGHHANGGQNLTIEWNVRSERCDKGSKKDGKDGFSHKDDSHLVLPEQHAYAKHAAPKTYAALKTYDVWGKKIEPHLGRRAVTREKIRKKDLGIHLAVDSRLLRIPTIPNNRKRGSRALMITRRHR
jgi:hypothetical protein